MAAVASRTSKIKVGSGGILLPQYSPFKVASQIAQLESLFPGRIEAGSGVHPAVGSSCANCWPTASRTRWLTTRIN